MHISEVIGINLGKRQNNRKIRLPAKPMADQVKHELMIRKLTKQLTRNSNLLKPTQQDINAAIERYNTNQKRVDLEYEKQINLAQQ